MKLPVRVSVIIPCYNVEPYIRRGLDSIVSQTLTEWEAILVDDGATDGTGEICEEYAANDRRFRVVHQQNQGPSCARNNGMKEAQGELLYFMDPDDWIEPDCFQRCYEAYQQYGGDIIHFGFWWVYGEKKYADGDACFRLFKGEDIFEYYTKQHAGFNQEALNGYYKGDFIWGLKRHGQVWSYMFRREFVQQNNLIFPPGLKMAEDAMFMVEATYRASQIVHIPDIFYHYVQRSDGLVNKKKDAEYIYEYKFRHLTERRRLREMVKEFDLHDAYLGSHILSCLQLALNTSDEWRNYKLYKQYVTHPDVQESISKVSLHGAPIKFAIPVYLLKMQCHFLLFTGCWLLHKTGLSNKVKM